MKGFKVLNCAITIIALVAIIVFCVIGFSFNMHGEYNDIFDRPGHHQIFTDTYKVSLLHPDTRGIVLFPLQAFFIGAIILAVISCGLSIATFFTSRKLSIILTGVHVLVAFVILVVVMASMLLTVSMSDTNPFERSVVDPCDATQQVTATIDYSINVVAIIIPFAITAFACVTCLVTVGYTLLRLTILWKKYNNDADFDYGNDRPGRVSGDSQTPRSTINTDF
jgi:hypothetical protein